MAKRELPSPWDKANTRFLVTIPWCNPPKPDVDPTMLCLLIRGLVGTYPGLYVIDMGMTMEAIPLGTEPVDKDNDMFMAVAGNFTWHFRMASFSDDQTQLDAFCTRFTQHFGKPDSGYKVRLSKPEDDDEPLANAIRVEGLSKGVKMDPFTGNITPKQKSSCFAPPPSHERRQKPEGPATSAEAE